MKKRLARGSKLPPLNIDPCSRCGVEHTLKNTFLCTICGAVLCDQQVKIHGEPSATQNITHPIQRSKSQPLPRPDRQCGPVIVHHGEFVAEDQLARGMTKKEMKAFDEMVKGGEIYRPYKKVINEGLTPP